MENDDTEAIKICLQETQALLLATRQLVESQQRVLTAMACQLHERQLLPLPVLIAALQSRVDFAQATRRDVPSEMLLQQIESFQQIADAYAARGPHR